MKKLRAFLLALAFVLSAGCVSPQPIIEGNTPQATAANAIARAEVGLIKGYRLVADQAANGILFKDELTAALSVLDKAAKLVNEAKDLYAKGVFDGALNKVLDADKALELVEAELAKKLKERRK